MTLDLVNENGKKMIIKPDSLEKAKEELESFTSEEKYMNNEKYARKVMYSQEVKSNNYIEGIKDELTLIENVINNPDIIKDIELRKRIINLYNGYKYILEKKDINVSNLRKLYDILSNGLLDEEDIKKMGEIYRNAEVYIFTSERTDIEPYMGMPYKDVEEYMNRYFEYVSSDNVLGNTLCDEYIKSQIMHFYFVYIHPFFDVNGRTSRTTSMWYLLNKEAYPYIIFNRAISFKTNEYYRTIIETRKYFDVTIFVKYMMNNVRSELEKEMIMHQIKESTPGKMGTNDYQSLIYLLSMNGEINTLSFTSMYNRYNDKKRAKDIYENILTPLLDKGIIEVVRTTKNNIYAGHPNEVYRINPTRYEKDSPKIKTLNMKNK